MTPPALILAGGKGERLRPLTDERPKPMVLLGGRPLLEYQVDWLVRQGIEDIVVACGYRAEVIQQHFGDGMRFGARIRYSVEPEPLGRGGALKLASSLIPSRDDLVVAVNGDTLTGQLIEPVIGLHRRDGALATVMVTQLVSPYGIVDFDQSGRIVDFIEKPRLPYWLNAGLYVLTREFFDRLPRIGDHETTTFPQLAREGKLYSYRSNAYWRTIDTVKDLLDLERQLEQRPFNRPWPPVEPQSSAVP